MIASSSDASFGEIVFIIIVFGLLIAPVVFLAGYLFISLKSQSQLDKPELNGCSLCGHSEHMTNSKKLYGYSVCKKCSRWFGTRRQVAYAIDWLLYIALVITFLSFIGLSNMSEEVLHAFFACFLFIFPIKDGFSGYSPGKYLLGLRVINELNGKPIGLFRSICRNFAIIVIPFMPLFIAVTLYEGPRFGDAWSHTKVIVVKYKNNPVFQKIDSPASA